MRRRSSLGILLGTDGGVVQVLPGDRPREVLTGIPVEVIDACDGVALATSRGRGVWLGNDLAWREVWSGDAQCARISPDGTLWVGAGRSELRYSTNGGESWELTPSLESVVRYERNRGRSGGSDGWRLAALGFPGNGVFAAVAGAGAWYSADRGRSWMPRAQDLNTPVFGVWEHPERRDRLYAATDGGLFRSDDEGFTWIRSMGGLDRPLAAHAAVLPGAPDVVVLSASRGQRDREGALYRSLNGGVTWSALALGGVYEWDQAPPITRLSESRATEVVVVDGRAWGTHDRGQTWLPIAEGLPRAHAITASL